METEVKKFYPANWENDYKNVEYRLRDLNDKVLELKNEGLESFLTTQTMKDLLSEPISGLEAIRESVIKWEADKVLRPVEKQAVRKKWEPIFEAWRNPFVEAVGKVKGCKPYPAISSFIHIRNSEYWVKPDARNAYMESVAVEPQPVHEEAVLLINELLAVESKLKAFYNEHAKTTYYDGTTDPIPYHRSKIENLMTDGVPDMGKIVFSSFK